MSGHFVSGFLSQLRGFNLCHNWTIGLDTWSWVSGLLGLYLVSFCNMIEIQKSHSHHLQPLLAEAIELISSQAWHCDLRHVFHEANRQEHVYIFLQAWVMATAFSGRSWSLLLRSLGRCLVMIVGVLCYLILLSCWCFFL